MNKQEPARTENRAEEILKLIREGNYNVTRPTALILPELLDVIVLLDKRTQTK